MTGVQTCALPIFLEVTDDAHVFDTLSGALLDLRIELEVVPDLDVKIRRK